MPMLWSRGRVVCRPAPFSRSYFAIRNARARTGARSDYVVDLANPEAQGTLSVPFCLPQLSHKYFEVKQAKDL